jgi:ring-1,2-phenylacetyl-CoA epoxidase subunit PaaD
VTKTLLSMVDIEAILATIPDPEIPVVNIRELGILRSITLNNNLVEVVITPTYSGCPAIDQIEDDIRAALLQHGLECRISRQLSPAWTTDWISADTREKLRRYGIAPPHQATRNLTSEALNVIQFAPKIIATRACQTGDVAIIYSKTGVECPQCGSINTTQTSHFASTACKALYKCLDCLEPFDYFKPY